MSRKPAVPSAWDDDWESQADAWESVPPNKAVEEEPKISKAERLARHAETNKKIWESAFVFLCLESFLIYLLLYEL